MNPTKLERLDDGDNEDDYAEDENFVEE